MHILQPGDPIPGRQCPECGGPMTMQPAPCPDPRPGLGCLVVHKRLACVACVACEERQWETHDRPATIAELNELGSKVDRLLAATGHGDG